MASDDTAANCTRCLEEMDHMIDPRLLPCGHVYCSICLDAAGIVSEAGVRIDCHYTHCSKSHTIKSVTLLPTAKMDNPVVDTAHVKETIEHIISNELQSIKTTLVSCSVCFSTEKTAEVEIATELCYCIHCKKFYCPMCIQRQSCDLAQSYTCHRTVSTEMYHKLQEMYINQSCAGHLSDISMACRDCFKLKCRHCRSSSSQPLPLCQDEQSHHFEWLADIRKDLILLHDKCTRQLAEIENVTKRTFYQLHIIEENCNSMRDWLQSCGDTNKNKLQDSILSYRAESQMDLEKYIGILDTDKDDLEKHVAWLGHQLIRGEDVIQMIRHRDTIWSLKNYRSVYCGYIKNEVLVIEGPSVSDYSALSPGCMSLMIAPIITHQLPDLPVNSVPHVVIYGSNCWPLWRLSTAGTGIIVATNSSILPSGPQSDAEFSPRIRTRATIHTPLLAEATLNGPVEMWELMTFPMTGASHSRQSTHFVGDMGDSIRFVGKISPHKNRENELVREPCGAVRSLGQTDCQESTWILFRFQCNHKVASNLAMMKNDEIVIVTNPGNNTLIAYNTQTNARTVTMLDFCPNACASVLDELVVTGGNSLRKYRLSENGTLKLVLTCKQNIQGAHGVAVTDNGIIIVQAFEKNALYLLSVFGELITVMEHDSLSRAKAGGMACRRRTKCSYAAIIDVLMPSSHEKSLLHFCLGF